MHNALTPRFFISWIGLATLTFLLMLTHQSEPATILGRYSLSYVALLSVVLGTLVVAGVGYVFSQRKPITMPTLNRLPIALMSIVLGMLMIIGIWLLPLTRFQSAIAVFSLYLAVLVFGALFIMLRHTKLPVPFKELTILAIVSTIIAIGIFFGRVPSARYYDEPLITNWAVSWAITQNPSNIAYNLFRTNSTISANAFLYPLGVWLNSVGVSFLNARLGAFLLGVLALPFIWDSVRRLYGKQIALWASLISVILLMQTYIRVDSGATLCIAIGIWLLILAEKHPILHLSAGFAFALAIEGHQLALRFALAYGGWCVLMCAYQTWTSKRLQIKPVLFLALGGFIAGILYLGLRLSWTQTDLTGYMLKLQEAFALENAIGGNLPLSQRILVGVQEWTNVFLTQYPLSVLIVGFASVCAWWFPTIRREVFCFWLALGIYFIMNPKPAPHYYYLHFVPLLALMFGGSLAFIQQKFNQMWLSNAWGILALTLLCIQLVISTRDIGAIELVHIGERINDILPANANMVVGAEAYYFGLHDRQFYDIAIYAKNSVGEISTRFNVPKPDAILLTVGRDSTLENARTYIEANNLQLAQCFDAPRLQWHTELYVQADVLPDVRNVDCP
jgi:hypothetical protein